MFGQPPRICDKCRLHQSICRCDHQPVPQLEPAAECDTDEPQTTRDADFVAKTHSELKRLTRELAAMRRNLAHLPCSDTAPCRHCQAIRSHHELIDDHLAQLETAALEAQFTESEPA